MSSDDNLTAVVDGLIDLYPSLVIQNYFNISGAVFFLYDYFLTLPLEVSQIWAVHARHRHSVFDFVHFLSVPDDPVYQECQVTFYVYMTIPIFINLVAFAIFILRTWVICKRSVIVLVLLLIPAIAGMVASVWVVMAETTTAYPPELQFGPYTCENNQLPIFAHGFASSIAFDAFVMILTVYQTARMVKQSWEVGLEDTLGYILLRDGLLYYIVIFLPTVIQVIFSIVIIRGDSSNIDLNAATYDVAGIVNFLQAVMINRLVLNLSYGANKQESLLLTRMSMDSPSFAVNSKLGNIGAPIWVAESRPENEDTQVVWETIAEGSDVHSMMRSAWDQMDIVSDKKGIEMGAFITSPAQVAASSGSQTDYGNTSGTSGA